MMITKVMELTIYTCINNTCPLTSIAPALSSFLLLIVCSSLCAVKSENDTIMRVLVSNDDGPPCHESPFIVGFVEHEWSTTRQL